MSTPTSGEWKVVKFVQQPDWHKEVWAGQTLVADLKHVRGSMAPAEELAKMEANAELAALSPKLHAAVKAIAEHPTDDANALQALQALQALARMLTETAAEKKIDVLHTPGPWEVGMSQHPRFRRDIYSDSGFIGCCSTQGNSIEEVEANATQIADAPGMLGILQAIAEFSAANPKEAFNSIQLLALAMLYKKVDLTIVKTTAEAKILVELAPAPQSAASNKSLGL